MNYIQLTEWGNKKTHLISTASITAFSFGGKYVEVRLMSGHVIIVTETRDEIEQMLLNLDSNITTPKTIKSNKEISTSNIDLNYERGTYSDTRFPTVERPKYVAHEGE